MKKALLWALPLMLSIGSGASLAQSVNSGDVRGTVTDQTGALIPQVKVTVVNVDTGHPRGLPLFGRAEASP